MNIVTNLDYISKQYKEENMSKSFTTVKVMMNSFKKISLMHNISKKYRHNSITGSFIRISSFINLDPLKA